MAAVLGDPARLRGYFTEARCVGTLCATRLGTFGPGDPNVPDETVEVDADVPMTPASVVKVPVALAAWRAIAAGELDARRRVVVPAIGRTPGPVGLSLMDDDVEMSLRDLVSLMLTISDNPATDAVIAAVGLDAVAALLAELGLAGTAVTSDLMTMLDDMATETGFADYAGLAAYEPTAPGDPTADDIRVRLAATAALDPTRGSRMTARDGVRLLGSIWQDRAGPPDACAWVRRTMGRQLTRHRIASGFPPGVDVAAKSGGLMGVVGNEIGVVTDPDGTSYAVAVFTRSGDPRTRTDARRIDAAIGAVAAHAVGLLRG